MGVMGVYGYLRVSMGFWVSMGDYERLYKWLWVYECLWVFMGMYGFLWVFMVILSVLGV